MTPPATPHGASSSRGFAGSVASRQRQHIRRLTLLLIVFLVCGSSRLAYALFCGSEIVSTGASRHEVLVKCGSPTFAEERVIYTTVYVYPGGYHVPHRPVPPSPPPSLGHVPQPHSSRVPPRNLTPVPPYAHAPVYVLPPPQPVLIPEVVEEWTYNFGPHNLMYRLRFVDGVVRDISTLRYGY